MTDPTRRVLLLDGARGIAAVFVVLFHLYSDQSSIIASFWVFVDFFFVLSGFVLYPSIQRIDSTLRLKRFLWNRMVRLFPMSYAALLLVISIQVFVNLKYLLEGSPIPEGIPMDFVTLILAFTLMQVFSLNAQLLLYPLWSLSVEWITNIIAAIVSVKIKFIGLLFFIVPGIFFLVVSLSQLTSGAVESVTNQLGRGMWAFGLGLMLQERKRMLTLLHNNFAKIMIVFICTYISVQLSISFSAWSSLGSPVLFAVAICYLDSIDEHKLGKGLMKVCKYLGRTSYGVYVWHVVASNLLALAIKNHLIKSDFLELYFGIPKAFLVFLITIVFTELTLRYLEAPLRARLTRG